jgi:hypothetical protein
VRAGSTARRVGEGEIRPAHITVLAGPRGWEQTALLGNEWSPWGMDGPSGGMSWRLLGRFRLDASPERREHFDREEPIELNVEDVSSLLRLVVQDPGR